MDQTDSNFISICLPIKNVAPYIRVCLDSIIAQSIHNWELIVVDDHSTDESADIVLDYCSRDTRIQFMHNSGKGILPALQLAFKQSKGTFITRMDGDDIMMPDKLATLQEGLLNHGPQHVTVGQVSYFSDTSLGDGFRKYEKWLNQLIASGSIWQDIYKECVVPSPCWMLYRTDFEALGAFDGNRYPEDYDLCFRMYKAALTAIPCQKILHRWRDYATRTSRTDPHYADNRFLDLKCHYFMHCDYNPDRSLLLWGAGKKAKEIAQWLIRHQIKFRWISNNAKKIGHSIYDIQIEDQVLAFSGKALQCIIAIANLNEQLEIRRSLDQASQSEHVDYYFFC